MISKARNKLEVKIYIDSIDDIYSDFDIRDIEIRTLSDDFIAEIKKQSKGFEHSSQIEIIIIGSKLLELRGRSRQVEQVIRQRIRNHFEAEYNSLVDARKRKIFRAFFFIVTGLICFISVKYISKSSDGNTFAGIIVDLVTFYSWFAMWHGIDLLQGIVRIQEIRFGKQLSLSEIHFKFLNN